MKLGSLFDGSGGFPLAGVINGIEPVWASEIEPFPIRVTKQRFPNMKHLGSVTDINGAEIEPVDIITFGSPCQDLSVAGKQLGIHDGQRSNLFFEAVRIIKEMREHDRATGRADVDIRPRFAVWENVPGAFSSNHGEDFKAVLQALCEIEDEQGVSVPMPSKGKWLPAGCIVGNGYSIAWRVYDAQYWGVPQRRKRIYLIADFASERAGEILFESESVSGDHQSGEPQGQRAADNAEGSAGRGDSAFNESDVGHWMDGFGCPAAFMGGQGAKARSIAYCQDGTTPTIKSAPSGGNTVPDVCYPINTMVATRHNRDDGRTTFGIGEQGDPQFTLQAAHEHAVCYSIEGHVIDRKSNQNGRGWAEGYAHTINATDHRGVVYGVDCRNGSLGKGKTHTIQAKNMGGFSYNCTPSVCFTEKRFDYYTQDEKASTLKARDYKGATDLIGMNNTRKYIVRRLTPTECARLQGFPDWWTDGADGSDSAKYKLWGNGIALPCAENVIGRIAKELNKEVS